MGAGVGRADDARGRRATPRPAPPSRRGRCRTRRVENAVRRSSATAMSHSASNGVLPRSAAISPTLPALVAGVLGRERLEEDERLPVRRSRGSGPACPRPARRARGGARDRRAAPASRRAAAPSASPSPASASSTKPLSERHARAGAARDRRARRPWPPMLARRSRRPARRCSHERAVHRAERSAGSS